MTTGTWPAIFCEPGCQCKRHNRTSPIDWVLCGTDRNARQHYRLKEKPCDACRIAHNMEQSLRRERRLKGK